MVKNYFIKWMLLSGLFIHVVNVVNSQGTENVVQEDSDTNAVVLNKIDLTDSDITDEGLKRLVSEIGNIRKFILSGCKNVSSNAFIDITDRLGYLEELDLSWTNISDYAVYCIMENCPRLRVLNLRGCRNLTENLFSGLNFNKYCLEELNLRWTRVADNTVRYVLELCPSLKKLNLESCDSISCNLFIDKYDTLCNLEELNLSKTRISNIGLCSVLEVFPNIKSLILRCCRNLRGDILVNLGTEMNNLKELNLNWTEVSVDGLYRVMDKCPHLDVLSIQYCRKLSADLFSRVDFHHLKELYYFNVMALDSEKEGLRSRYPGITIH